MFLVRRFRPKRMLAAAPLIAVFEHPAEASNRFNHLQYYVLGLCDLCSV